MTFQSIPPSLTIPTVQQHQLDRFWINRGIARDIMDMCSCIHHFNPPLSNEYPSIGPRPSSCNTYFEASNFECIFIASTSSCTYQFLCFQWRSKNCNCISDFIFVTSTRINNPSVQPRERTTLARFATTTLTRLYLFHCCHPSSDEGVARRPFLCYTVIDFCFDFYHCLFSNFVTPIQIKA